MATVYTTPPYKRQRTPNQEGYRGVGSPPPRDLPPTYNEKQARSNTRAASIGRKLGESARNKLSATANARGTAAKGAFKKGGRRIGPVAGLLEGVSATEDIALGTPEGATLGAGGMGRAVESGGRLAAIVGGAKLGAAGGTAILPGWGTGIGALGGAIGGGLLYDSAGRAVRGGELPSEERARLRNQAGDPAAMMSGFNPTVGAMGRGAAGMYRGFRDFEPAAATDETASATGAASPAATPSQLYAGRSGGQQMLSNVPFDGGVPQVSFDGRMGTVTNVPAENFIRMGLPDNSGARRAAAARGDWAALERVGAISPRGESATGGAAGGGAAGGGRSNQLFDRAMGALDQAAELRDRARHYSGISRMSERNSMLMQAEALEGSAKSMMGTGASVMGIEGRGARGGAPGSTELDAKTMSEIQKNLSQAGLYDAQAFAAMEETGQIDPRMITALTSLGTPEGDMYAQLLTQTYTNKLMEGEVLDTYGDFNNITPDEFQSLNPQMQAVISRFRPDLRVEEEPGMFDRFRGAIEGLAEGGYIDPMMDMEGAAPMSAMDMAGGGMGMDMGMDPLQLQYQQYVEGARQLGMPEIPFEVFVEIMQRTQQNAAQQAEPPVESFAGGGEVNKNQFGYAVDSATGRTPVGADAWGRASAMAQPAQAPSFSFGKLGTQAAAAERPRVTMDDLSSGGGNPGYGYANAAGRLSGSSVRAARDQGNASFSNFAEGGPVSVDGKLVVDPDPNAPTDSIPAVIDGQRPAALDSGEFVWPDDVVRFHGTDKLNKMMQQARQGATDGANARATGPS